MAPPFAGRGEKQEQSLAGGTAGLRTWVHLTRGSPGKGVGDVPAGLDERRWELRVWSLDSEPQGTFLGWKCLGRGFPREANSQNQTSLTHRNKNQTVCHPYLANGRWHVFPCLLTGGQCVDLASSKRLVVQLLSTQAEGMELSLGTSQQESPGTGYSA